MSKDNEQKTTGRSSPSYYQSDAVGEIAKALCKVQASMPTVTKGQENPFFKSKYADLSSIWDAVREHLAKHGLSIIQLPTNGGLTTTILHESGEWISGTMDMCLDKQTPQGQGSAITYARRYALSAAIGVCPVDDDGEAAERPHRGGKESKPPDFGLIAANHILAINKIQLIEGRGSLAEYWGKHEASIESIKQADKENHGKVMAALKDKKKELKAKQKQAEGS